MNVKKPLLSPLVLIILSIASFQLMAEDSSTPSFATQGSQLAWKSTAGSSIPEGALIVVLYEDPKSYLASRIKADTGYAIQKHKHSSTEYVSVISGSIEMDHWEGDKRMKMTLSQGGFARMEAGTFHALQFMGDKTQIEVHYEGPYDIIYADPKDDPRLKNK